jgi:hypothetical protein
VERTTSGDELVPLRARVRSEILDALQKEALARRVPPGRLLGELLVAGLPDAAADRVRRQLAPARSLRAVPAVDHSSERIPAFRSGSTPTTRRGTADEASRPPSIGSIPARRLNKGSSSDAGVS